MRTADVWDARSRNHNVIYMNEHSVSGSETNGAWARRFIFILRCQSVVEMKFEISPIHHVFDWEPLVQLYAAPETFGSEICAADSVCYIVLVGLRVWYGIH